MKRRLESGALLVSLGLAGYAFWGLVGSAVPEATPVATAPVVAPADVIEVAEHPLAVPRIDELPQSVAHVLAENGNASVVERTVLEEVLPASVVAVLVDEGAVLRVADASTQKSVGVAP